MNQELLDAIENLQNAGCDSEDILRVLNEMLYGLERGYHGYHMNCVNSDIVDPEGFRDWFRDYN